MTTAAAPGEIASARALLAARQIAARRLLRAARAVLPLAVVVLLALVTAVVPRVIGAVPLTVLSASMEPALSAGDLVVVRPVDPADLRVGDVITVQPATGDPTLVTHRVTAVERVDGAVASVQTRGDANGAADDPVLPAQVQGRVLYSVPLVGHLTHNPWARTAAVAALTGLLIRALRTTATARTDSREDSAHAPR